MQYRLFQHAMYLLLPLLLLGCSKNDAKSHPCDGCLGCEECTENETGELVCAPLSKQRTQCLNGDIHWFDSCDSDEGIAQSCPESHSQCLDHSNEEQSPTCACTGNWTGDNCDVCSENWDIETECTTCLYNWTGDDCQTCPEHWDPNASCNQCLGNWDLDQDCVECRNHWEGAQCSICPGNWDPSQDCGECRNKWTGPNCTVCPTNYDSSTDCAYCLPGWGGDLCSYAHAVVDSASDVGKYTSVANGFDDLPVIAYQDSINLNLKVAHCEDTVCSNATISTVYNDNEPTGEDISLTIGNDGYAIMSYHHNSSDLRIARCTNTDCTGTTVAHELVWLDTGKSTSITIGSDGLAILSQFRITANNIGVVHCADPLCNATQSVDLHFGSPTTMPTSHTSIAIAYDGDPIIAFVENNHLVFKRCTQYIICAEETLTPATTIDNTGAVGQYNDMTVGWDDKPIISYYDATQGNLVVAHCGNSSCSSVSRNVIDSNGNVGQYTSIAIGTDGMAIISYRDVTNSSLKVAHCNNTLCSSSDVYTVDDTGDVGEFSSIAIGANGNPIISYYDSTNGDLKMIRCENLDCSP